MEGWVKIYRSTQSHWIADDADFLRGWVLLLLAVNYKTTRRPFNGQMVELQPGEMVTSFAHLATVLRMQPGKVRRFLELLQADEMITVDATTRGTKVTVCNYSRYQETEQTDNKQTANKQQTNSNTIRKKERKNISSKIEESGATKFMPPELSEVLDYAAQILLRPDHAENFYDHFEANGWKVSGKTPMKNWRAALRRWSKSSPPMPEVVARYFADSVSRYFTDHNEASITAQKFYQYYEARGWKTATGVRVNNWKLKADEWITSNRGQR